MNLNIRKEQLCRLGVLLFVITTFLVTVVILQKNYQKKLNRIHNASVIIIDKNKMELRMIDYMGKDVLTFPIACGKNYGNKRAKNDMKTPEGIFHISDIQDASPWTHDFHDGKGEIKGAYGPYFLRLEVPGHQGIGIHGTHNPKSIGTRATEGCIRLKNDDLKQLVMKVNKGMVVICIPSDKDVLANSKIN